MKRSYLFSVILLCTVSAFAGPVTMEKAAEKASAFFRTRGMGDQNTISLAYQCRQVATTGMAVPAKDAYYYVFNNNNEGFVVVSGDDCADDVLGYSESGSFDADNIPENLRGLLDYYSAEIEWARSNKEMPSQDNSSAPAYIASATEPAIAPLLTSMWSQHRPYNEKCYYGGVLAAAGCTAIAMAQVMNYYKYPKASTTSIPYYAISGWGSKGALSATTFNWSLIKDNYSRTDVSDTDSRAEVAKLVQYCGYSIKTQYYTNSSSAYMEFISPALCNYFGYKNVARIRERKFYTTTEWTKMLLNELKNGRPVIYSASKYGNYGHAFVIDGFDGTDMFHINTGWGLTGCGYYKLSALNIYWASGMYTPYQGSFSFNQKAIFGIYPTELDGSKGGMTLLDLYMCPTGNSGVVRRDTTFAATSKGLKGVMLRCQYTKTGPNKMYNIGVGIFQNGKLVGEKSMTNYDLTNEYIKTCSHDLSGLGANLADGSYVIKCMDRVDENSPWKVCEQSDIMYVALTKKDGMFTLKTYPVAGTANLKLVSMKQLYDVNEKDAYAGKNLRHLQVTLKNTGTAKCNEKIYLRLGGYEKTVEGVNIGAGETVPVDFYFFSSTGTYAVTLVSESGKVIYDSKISILDNSALPILDLVSYNVNNLVGDIVYGTEIEADLVLKNSSTKAYSFNMNVDIYIEEYGTNIIYLTKKQVDVAAGKTVMVPIRFDLGVGDKFKIQVSDQNAIYMKTGQMVVNPAVVIWDGSGKSTTMSPSGTITVPASATAVSLVGVSDLSKVVIKPNNNPNTLYYLRSDATVPTSLSKKNVVKGTHASSITMLGGYDFYVPKSFKADKISYSFTPNIAYNGKGGWQTIMLPFGVTSVTSDGKAVDWCKKPSDDDKQFLLKLFASDTATEAKFENVDGWMPYSPYLLGVPASLINKKMVFSATGAEVPVTGKSVVTGTYFRFVGSTEEKTVSNALLLNDEGSGFVMTTSGLVKAGGAYMEPLNTKSSTTKTMTIAGSIIDIPGDINGDNAVTVADALNVINVILGGNMTKGDFDVNNDGRVTVTDVMFIINLLVNNE